MKPCPPRRSGSRPGLRGRRRRAGSSRGSPCCGSGCTVEPFASASRRSTRKIDMPSDFLRHLLERRRAREQHHQIRVLHARDPHLLPVDRRSGRPSCTATVLIFVVSVPAVGSVTANDCSRSSPVAIFGRYLRFCSADPCRSTRAHVVHLPMARARVAARAVDLLHDHRRFGEREPEPPYSSGISAESQPALRQRLDERLRIGAVLVDLLPVRAVELACTRRARLRAIARADRLANDKVRPLLDGRASADALA